MTGTIWRDGAGSRFVGNSVKLMSDRDRRLAELEASLQQFQSETEQQLAAAEQHRDELSETVWLRDQEISYLTSSLSWRITRPLRLLNHFLLPLRRRLLVGMRLRRLRAKLKGPAYQDFVETLDRRQSAQAAEIQAHILRMTYRPTFSIVVDARHGTGGLAQTVQSARAQCYPVDVAVVAGDVSEVAKAGVEARLLRTPLASSDLAGEFLIFLRCGQSLAPTAVYEFAALLNQRDDVDLIYADEDVKTQAGNCSNPFYKPTWSPDYLETFNYIGFPACFRRSCIPQGLEFVDPYDFVLRYTERTQRVRHVARVLGHNERPRDVDPQTRAADIAALEGRLSRTGRRGAVRVHPSHPGCYEIELALKQQPLVSIIIPTAGKTIALDGRRIDLVVNLVDQVRTRSTYRNVEIIVVDNGDLSAPQLDTLARLGCVTVTYREPVFNISRKLNLGASVARGELLVLLNDDIEILAPSWIERMVEHFEKPNVGVVGAKLLYPDGSLQHVGVVHNSGRPEHVRRSFPRDDPGYFFSTCGVRNYLAITGACMMTPARIFRDVGGYNERLAIDYNDVDYCLKLAGRGLSVVYAPAAELTHMEAQSRDLKVDWRGYMLFLREWGPEVLPDRFYNQRFLSVEPPTFVPCVNPRLI